MLEENLPDDTASFWVETEYLNHYPVLDEELNTDIAIIGGGIAGILSAYRLAKEGKNVVLLEGRDFLSGTTGYTTAKLSAQHQLIYDDLINRYGQEYSKLYYQANMEGIAYIKQIKDEHHINCQLQEQDSFVYTQEKNKREAFKKEVEAYKKLGIQGELLQDLPLNIDIEAAVKMEKQAQFQPVTFLNGVLDKMKDFDVKVFEHSLVTMVNQDEENGKVELQTANGSIVTCSKAVFATHYPTFDPDNFYTSMIPEISYAIALKVTKEQPDGMYINDDLPKRTFRNMVANGEDYLLVGGQSHPIGDQQSELERYNDLYQFAKETFDETNALYRWSSHDLITKDRIPFIGQLHPDYANIYTLTGFSKWGLANAATGAKVIADLISGRKNRYEAMYHPHRKIPDIQKIGPDSKHKGDPISEQHLSIEPASLKINEATIIQKDNKKIGIYKDNDEKLHHLDISCTHLGCDLSWNNGDQTWDCPCHGSRFNATGQVIEGPAIEDLKKSKG